MIDSLAKDQMLYIPYGLHNPYNTTISGSQSKQKKPIACHHFQVTKQMGLSIHRM